MKLDKTLQQDLDELAIKLKQVSNSIQLNPETGKYEYTQGELCNQRK